MRLLVTAALALSLALAACGDEGTAAEGSTVPSSGYEVETVVQGLRVPWDIAFAPDGRMFVTERPGAIRVVRDGVLQDEPFAVLDVWAQSEAGLMGIALHPDFAANGHLYVCYTYIHEQRGPTNRVARLTDADGVGTDHTVVFDGIPGARNHNGCRIRFGPDDKLYVTMGDAQNGDLAQDPASPAGKILRLNPDGTVPDDNPIEGNPLFTLGHRNPQGIDWHPDTGDPFITEHGPSDNDEINVLVAGANYGWPEVRGIAEDPAYVDPIKKYTPTLALAGAAFYTGGPLPLHWTNSFFFTTLKDRHVRRLSLAEGPDGAWTVVGEEKLIEDEFGRLRAIVQGPDGYLYVTTSNRDGRGSPARFDDKVLRIVPAAGE
ncbi:MAG: PQQ-dependent sugar dehydrogenase [Chloroflexota bacterium]|nr:PQQ-dependent sugar dehydrogenase [Chloroflexota bacterium]